MRYLAVLWMCLSFVYGTERGPCLADDAFLEFPEKYRPCMDVLVRVMEPTCTYKQAIPIIKEHWDLLKGPRKSTGPDNLKFVAHYAQTLRDERDRLKAIVTAEKAKEPSLRRPDYVDVDEAYGEVVNILFSVESFHRRNQTASLDTLNLILTSLSRFFERLPRTDPFTLTPLLSLATHKLFFMSYINVVLIELVCMVNDKTVLSPAGPYTFEDGSTTVLPHGGFSELPASLNGTLIHLERDGDKLFTEVFDRVQREIHQDIVCGSRIFDYVRVMLPWVRFIPDVSATEDTA